MSKKIEFEISCDEDTCQRSCEKLYESNFNSPINKEIFIEIFKCDLDGSQVGVFYEGSNFKLKRTRLCRRLETVNNEIQ